MFSARSHSQGICDSMKLGVFMAHKDSPTLYWMPVYPYWRKRMPPKQLVERKARCLRCGKIHRGLIFRKLAKPMTHPALGATMDYWATCPNTGEPMVASGELMKACGEVLP